MVNNNQFYLGNQSLKAANVHIEFTEEQVQEYIKCQNDPIYFIKNYVKIVNVDLGFVKFNTYDYQEDLVKMMHNNRFCIAKMPRQSGKSSIVVAYFLWLILFNKDMNIALLANKLETSRELLSRLKLSYESLPLWIQQGVIKFNETTVKLDNRSSIIAAATSSSAIRGKSFSIVFIDEMAHIPTEVSEEFFNSVYPTISSGKTTKLFIVSTPLGMNQFYKMWVEAEEGRNRFKIIDIPWDAPPGRDEQFKKDTISEIGELAWNQEFACEFLGSENTLISSVKLKQLAYRTPLYTKGNMNVYEDPLEEHMYVATVDVSSGVGRDYSVINMFDVTKFPYKQVAIWRHNEVSELMLPNVIASICHHYNEALVLVENNFGTVADSLHQDFEYENTLSTSFQGGNVRISSGFAKKMRFGIKTTKLVKNQGCTNLKEMIEADKLIINDFETIKELYNFVDSPKGYKAISGEHDDIVITLVIFCWLSTQEYFKEYTDLDLREIMREFHENRRDEDMTPFGFLPIDNNETEKVFVDTDGSKWDIQQDNDNDSWL